ncbi:MAG: hydroxyacylglutathione hydrolase [Gammaproteobacteria bacterium]|nr:hydroxyacylglutathione hydrolase [Gammaproteobacteria bacterium]
MSQTLEVSCVDAFEDNYIWLIHSQNHDNKDAIVIVDPGEPNPVIKAIETHQYKPAAIFITHHHGDHTGGVRTLVEQYQIPVYGPKNENIPVVTIPCDSEQIVTLPELALEFQVLDVPGHTRGHIAYLGHSALFIGDTLFAGGCGRLFEGTGKQMHQSLSQLLTLDPNTLVYCAHEYTIDNLNFAIQVEPDNQTLIKRIEDTKELRNNNQRTVPSLLSLELTTNPFLRFDQNTVKYAAREYTGQALLTPDAVFTATRNWKDDVD